MIMNRIICFSVICAFVFLSETYAQEDGFYQVIVVNGRIVDQQSGKVLQSKEQVYLQTMLLFCNASDYAVLRSPSKIPYRLVSQEQLLTSSEKSLREIENRPMTYKSLRTSKGDQIPITPELFENYFGADAFAIIGSSLKLDISGSDAQKYDLVFRFEENNKTKEVISEDFVIRQNDMGRAHIDDCLILLREGEKMTEVTRITLCFVDEQNLFQEFDAWMHGLDIDWDSYHKIREELYPYYINVYGYTDENELHEVVDRYIESRTR